MPLGRGTILANGKNDKAGLQTLRLKVNKIFKGGQITEKASQTAPKMCSTEFSLHPTWPSHAFVC